MSRHPGRIITGAEMPASESVETDFCVVGSGAGGSIAAAVLAEAGAKVIVLEEGGHYTKRDFNMQEAWAYPALYQDHGNRATEDLSILVLQGRGVGGGTLVNWTSSFRTPEMTLRLWAARHGVRGLDAAALAPHFAAVEQRLGIHPGEEADVNRNNRKLWEGAQKLGFGPELIPRNVKGCARLGVCGLGCPIDAKQSAHITYVTDAVAAGARVHTDCRARLVETDRGRARAVVADVLDRERDRPKGRFVVYARHGVVLAGGAINTPALLLRSKAGVGSGLVGRRTFLHPTVAVIAYHDDPIEGFYGPPQSVAVRKFADRGADVGYFMETAPVQPMLAGLALPGRGDAHRKLVERLAHAQVTIGLVIDGHHDDEGGRVAVDGGGRIKVSYPVGPALREAAGHAVRSMARMQLAAGAREVTTLHEPAALASDEAGVEKLVAAGIAPNRPLLFSAHQMGGCAMGDDPARSVVDSRGRHHEIENLWITDGSVFPTGVGINPMLTIYAVARLFATEIARGAGLGKKDDAPVAEPAGD